MSVATGDNSAMAPRDLPITTLTAPGGDLEARFVPGAGMVGCSLTHRGEELLGLRGGLDAYLERGKTFGLPLLYPWANRLGAWEYEAAGRAVAIDRDSAPVRADPHDLPIHGALPTGCAWRLRDVGADDDAAWLAAELHWTAGAAPVAIFPFAHRVRIAVRLTDDTVRLVTTVHATGADAVPLAFGFHPYLAPPGAPRARWEVGLPAMTHLALDDRGLPTGAREARPAETFTLADRTFDDLYALDAGPARFAVDDGVRRIAVTFEEGYTHTQVFAPPTEAVVCFEPMTAPVDALRTHDALRLVAPGADARAVFAVRVEAR
jgi:aldose 1-epimerase